MSISLSSVFNLDSGDTRTISVSNIKEAVTDAEVLAFGNAMVENGSAFEDAITSIAKLTLTETTRTVVVDNT